MISNMRMNPAIALGLALAATTARAQSDVAGVRAAIESLIARSGGEAAVVWQPLDADRAAGIRINDGDALPRGVDDEGADHDRAVPPRRGR